MQTTISPPSRTRLATTEGWTLLGVTLALSTFIVWLFGGVFGNPDAAILAVLMPSAVAIVLTVRSRTPRGVRSLLRWSSRDRSSRWPLAVALLGIPTLSIAAVAITGAATGEQISWTTSATMFNLVPVAVIALGEEYGWRGFALPRLQTRFTALTAGLIVAAVHLIWHVPAALIGTGVPLDVPFWLFGIWVLAFGVLLASLYNASGGNVGTAIIAHFAANLSFVFLPLLPDQRNGDMTAFAVLVALMVVTAAFVTRVYSPATLAPQRKAV